MYIRFDFREESSTRELAIGIDQAIHAIYFWRHANWDILASLITNTGGTCNGVRPGGRPQEVREMGQFLKKNFNRVNAENLCNTASIVSSEGLDLMYDYLAAALKMENGRLSPLSRLAHGQSVTIGLMDRFPTIVIADDKMKIFLRYLYLGWRILKYGPRNLAVLVAGWAPGQGWGVAGSWRLYGALRDAFYVGGSPLAYAFSVRGVELVEQWGQENWRGLWESAQADADKIEFELNRAAQESTLCYSCAELI